MAASERTKQCRTGKFIFSILHFLALFGPFLYFIPYCFAVGEVSSKIVIGLAVSVAIIMCIMALVIDQVHKQGLFKSSFWVLVAGVTLVLNNIAPFIYIMAGVSLLDELLFVRMRDSYSAKLLANKEIDKRNR